jgi:hypothetical protein
MLSVQVGVWVCGSHHAEGLVNPKVLAKFFGY